MVVWCLHSRMILERFTSLCCVSPPAAVVQPALHCGTAFLFFKDCQSRLYFLVQRFFFFLAGIFLSFLMSLVGNWPKHWGGINLQLRKIVEAFFAPLRKVKISAVRSLGKVTPAGTQHFSVFLWYPNTSDSGGRSSACTESPLLSIFDLQIWKPNSIKNSVWPVRSLALRATASKLCSRLVVFF